MTRLTIRNAWLLDGTRTDLALRDGRIAAIGPQLASKGQDFDAAGCTLLPGLHDHHLHILATAARRQSVDLSGLLDREAIIARLRAAHGASLRAMGYDERAAGLPDAALLDCWEPDRPVRLQDRTGALWVLNHAALALLGERPIPAGAELDASGHPTGRFWREDKWLGQALPRHLPDVARLGRELAALGLTALTDAGAGNGPEEARLLAGKLPQRLTLMGDESLAADEGYRLGPLKLLFDERDPPEVEALAARISSARNARRAVAAHCVTEGELAIFLAALDAAGGALPGDRVEHGALISTGFVPIVARSGLTVVTNPAFLHDRGDRYLDQVPPESIADLYRAQSLQTAGIALLAGSDAPYASFDPWLGMRSARDRLTARRLAIGLDERLSAQAALSLWSNGRIEPGAPADLVMCEGNPADVLADLDAGRVKATIIAGKVV